jgi:hypothetical protein
MNKTNGVKEKQVNMLLQWSYIVRIKIQAYTDINVGLNIAYMNSQQTEKGSRYYDSMSFEKLMC